MAESWEECGLDAQALILAFDQTATHDEEEWQAKLAGASMNPTAASSK